MQSPALPPPDRCGLDHSSRLPLLRDCYTQAAAIDSRNPVYRSNISAVYLKCGRYKEALAETNKAGDMVVSALASTPELSTVSDISSKSSAVASLLKLLDKLATRQALLHCCSKSDRNVWERASANARAIMKEHGLSADRLQMYAEAMGYTFAEAHEWYIRIKDMSHAAATSTVGPQMCAFCGVEEGQRPQLNAEGEILTQASVFKRCSQCKNIFYCSVACQKQDWKQHAKQCRELGVVARLMEQYTKVVEDGNEMSVKPPILPLEAHPLIRATTGSAGAYFYIGHDDPRSALSGFRCGQGESANHWEPNAVYVLPVSMLILSATLDVHNGSLS